MSPSIAPDQSERKRACRHASCRQSARSSWSDERNRASNLPPIAHVESRKPGLASRRRPRPVPSETPNHRLGPAWNKASACSRWLSRLIVLAGEQIRHSGRAMGELQPRASPVCSQRRLRTLLHALFLRRRARPALSWRPKGPNRPPAVRARQRRQLRTSRALAKASVVSGALIPSRRAKVRCHRRRSFGAASAGLTVLLPPALSAMAMALPRCEIASLEGRAARAPGRPPCPTIRSRDRRARPR